MNGILIIFLIANEINQGKVPNSNIKGDAAMNINVPYILFFIFRSNIKIPGPVAEYQTLCAVSAFEGNWNMNRVNSSFSGQHSRDARAQRGPTGRESWPGKVELTAGVEEKDTGSGLSVC